MGDLAVLVMIFLAVAAITFDPLAAGPASGEALTAEEESLLDEDGDE